ncbi:hypothetical protein PaG_02727 [Moesziomyces aphidis]|uniref:Uncharacterized protein n=1 Tax=Moesziomyces aphidis TaxID=84754 RepID=W3VMS9_MOEAP|nr:hypothetical protein PaG_02727 [Moesziomyces aphidis]
MTPDETRDWMVQQLALRNAASAKVLSPAAPKTGPLPQSVSAPQTSSRVPLAPRPLLTKENMLANIVPTDWLMFPWNQFSLSFLIRAVHFYDPEQHKTAYKKNKAWSAVASEVQTALRTQYCGDIEELHVDELKLLWKELSSQRSHPSSTKTWEPHFNKYEPEVLRMLDEVVQSDLDRYFGPGEENLAAMRQQSLASLAKYDLLQQQAASKRISQQSAPSKQAAQQSMPPNRVLQPFTPPKQVSQQPIPPRRGMTMTAATPPTHPRPETSNDFPSGAAAQRKRPREAADDATESLDDRHAETRRQRDAILRAKEGKVRALEDANAKRDEMIQRQGKQNVMDPRDMVQEVLKMTKALKEDLSRMEGRMTLLASAFLSAGGMAGLAPQLLAGATAAGRSNSTVSGKDCAPTAESSSTTAVEAASTSETPGSPLARQVKRPSTTSK